MSWIADRDAQREGRGAGAALEELLADCLAGEPGERLERFERTCSTHPDLAPALRRRWSALADMGLVDALPPDGATPEFPDRLGDFRLVRRLGGGGMGVVYLALQESLGREVALKLIRPDQLYFPGVRARFEREARAVSRLSHPGIVPVHVVGEERGIPFFAMELVRGCSLADALAELGGRAPESLTGRDLGAILQRAAGADGAPAPGSLYELDWVAACVDIARQVAEALAHAHGAGCLHRDVKPSNVMLTPDGRALLVDFGLTALQGSQRQTRTGARIGTLLYMAPEQLSGKAEADARTDVYGLGVTLYEALALQTPFRGADEVELLQRVARGLQDPLRARNRKISADAETVCLKAIDADRSRRYGSARAFAADLSALLNGAPVSARPPGPWRRGRRAALRHPFAAAAVLVACAAAVATPLAIAAEDARAARVEREKLAAQVEIARGMGQCMDFLATAMGKAPGSAPGVPPTLKEMLDCAMEHVDEVFNGEQAWCAARLRTMVGNLYVQQRASERAVAELERALAFYDAHPELDPIKRGPSEATIFLALAATQVGDYARAEELVLPAIARLEKLPPDPTNKLELCRVVLADVWEHTGRESQAEEFWRGWVSAPESSYDVSLRLAQLGTALLEGKRYGEAEPYLARAVEGLRQDPLVDVPNLVSALSNLGLAHKMQGEVEDAQALYGEALGRIERTWTAPSLLRGSLLVNLATLLEKTGRPDEAIARGREAVETLAPLLGPRHRSVLVARGNLVGMLVRAGHCDEAEPMAKELAGDMLAVLPASDPLAALAMRNQARCASERGDGAAAAELLRRGLELLASCPGAGAETAALRSDLEALGEDAKQH